MKTERTRQDEQDLRDSKLVGLVEIGLILSISPDAECA